MTGRAPPCTRDDHAALVADLDRYRREMRDVRPWPGLDLVSGECPRCRSTLSMDAGRFHAATAAPHQETP